MVNGWGTDGVYMSGIHCPIMMVKIVNIGVICDKFAKFCSYSPRKNL